VPRVVFEPGAKLDRIGRKLSDPTPALKQIGALMTAESQAAFRAQQFGKNVWRERAPVNVFGIIADFHAGRRQPPARRFESRPVMQDTGRLAQSIAWQLVGASAVEVGTNLPYARELHRGGEVESKPITETVQQSLWAWLRTQGRERKRQLGWLLNRKFRNRTLKHTVPARPIVGVTQETREGIRLAIGVEIMEVGR